MKLGSLAVFLLLLLTTAPACAKSGPPTRTSLCKLVNAGEQMNGLHVRLTAIYITDLFENSSLKDRRCPTLYVVPYDSRQSPQDQSLEEFDKALYEHQLDFGELTQFSIDVSGKFVWWANNKPHGALIFEKIWSFKRIRGDWKKAE